MVNTWRQSNFFHNLLSLRLSESAVCKIFGETLWLCSFFLGITEVWGFCLKQAKFKQRKMVSQPGLRTNIAVYSSEPPITNVTAIVEKNLSKKWLWNTGTGSKWTYVWTENPLMAIETAELYLNNSDIPWKELCKDRESQHRKCGVWTIFLEQGFPL